MATIGHRAAVADAFGHEVHRRDRLPMWAFIHVLYLIGWGNRLGTLYTWARALSFSQEPRAPDHHLRAGARTGAAGADPDPAPARREAG